MSDQTLKNKKIIISAGASGIGLATAKICLSRGAFVYLCDLDIKSLNKLNKHPLINKKLFTYICDASNEGLDCMLVTCWSYGRDCLSWSRVGQFFNIMRFYSISSQSAIVYTVVFAR